MGNINNLNQNAFRALQAANRSNPKELTEKEANIIKRGVMADKKVDSEEQKLLNALTENSAPKLKVSAKKTATFNPSDLDFNKNVSSGAKKVLQGIKSVETTNPLENMWNEGPAGLKKLVDKYKGSPKDRSEVKSFLVDKLNTAWKNSSWKDGYQDLRSLVTQGYSNISKLEGNDFTLGKQMFYESILEADKGTDGSTVGGIPDFIYDWMKN